MFKVAFVKPAFHMAWFVLILGGASLFEKNGWGLFGAIMLLYGICMLAYTAFAIYLHKPLVKNPSILLIVALILIMILIVAHIIFEHYILALVLATLCIPLLVGYLRIKGKRHEISMPAKR